MDTPRIRLEGISSRQWEHPADRAALTLASSIPGAPELIRAVGGLASDRVLRAGWLASAVRSGPLQIPTAHEAVVEACRVLDVSPVPAVFVTPGLDFNARVLGFEQPFVVLGGGLVGSLTADELLTVAGHEVGHIKAGHVVYRTTLWILSHLAVQVPQLEALQLPLVALLKDWERKSELSCDRAGLLACQNPVAALSALKKVCYPGLADRIDEAELLRQAADWDAAPDLLDSLAKVIGSWSDSHPAFVNRYAALKVWSEGPEYPALLAGSWRDSPTPEPTEPFVQAWDTLKNDLAQSRDPAAQMASQAIREVENFFQGLGRR